MFYLSKMTKLGLSKKNILIKPSVLDLVFSSGQKESCSPFSLYYIKDEALADFRVAFSVGKKTHRLAVTRNKIKRLMREAFRLNVGSVNNKELLMLNMVFVYYGSYIPDYAEVETSVKNLLVSLSKNLTS
tara:strand:+ start:293 stop:682 length:390 start_codon:yes stop_codon:yes gene_type:complete